MTLRLLISLGILFSSSFVFAEANCSNTPSLCNTTPSANFQNGADIKMVELAVRHGKSISLPLPNDWNINISRENPNATTLKATTNKGDDVTLLATAAYINSPLTKREKKEFIQKVRYSIISKYSQKNSNKILMSRPIKIKKERARGHLYTFIDVELLKEKKLNRDESVYVSTGVVIMDDMLFFMTILTNDLKIDNYGKAFQSIQSFSRNG